jgi:membrane protein implicated in regulation of membrane protease activity
MDWLSDHLWEMWLAIAILLALAEMLSLDLFLLMMAIGALAGMGLELLGAPFWAQAVGAGGVALAMLVFVRKPIAERLHRGPEVAMGTTRLIGQRAVVTAEISGGGSGLIRLDGEIWTAATQSADVLKPGDPVDVVQIDGATAFVQPAASDRGSEPTT